MEFIIADKKNISSLSLLQSFSYVFNILDFIQNEEGNLQIDRFGYEAVQNEKTDEEKGMLCCPSSLETPLLSDLEKFINKKYEETTTTKDFVILDPKRILHDKDCNTSYGAFINHVKSIGIITAPNTDTREDLECNTFQMNQYTILDFTNAPIAPLMQSIFIRENTFFKGRTKIEK